MKLLIATSLTLLSYLSFCQNSALETGIVPGPEWYEGSILLSNGKELEGLLRYNDKSEILSYENGRNSKSFTPRNVIGFEFFDEIAQRQRVFYAVPFEDHRQNIKRPLFFEVILDLGDFALISKIAPIRFDRREYSTPALFNPTTGAFSGGRYYGYPTTISHTETIFLMPKSGGLKPYLEIIEKNIDGTIFDRSKTRKRILDQEVIKTYTSPYYKQLLAFAKKNDLSFKTKNDLIKILSYYGELARK